ncbi:hypothetical protein D3C81_1606320 [compost metagenome]
MDFIDHGIFTFLIALDIRRVEVLRIGLAQIDNSRFTDRISVSTGCACRIDCEYGHRFRVRVQYWLRNPVIGYFILVVVAADILFPGYSGDVFGSQLS